MLMVVLDPGKTGKLAFHIGLIILHFPQTRTFYMDQRKYEIVLDSRQFDLMFQVSSIQFMQLKVNPTQGRKTSKS
jgi:hypothetical protein